VPVASSTKSNIRRRASRGFVNWLQIRTNEELHRVAVAIESPRGALVDTLPNFDTITTAN
jgi:hypothetical protein